MNCPTPSDASAQREIAEVHPAGVGGGVRAAGGLSEKIPGDIQCEVQLWGGGQRATDQLSGCEYLCGLSRNQFSCLWFLLPEASLLQESWYLWVVGAISLT